MSSVISPVSPVVISDPSTTIINPIAQRRADGESAVAPVGAGQQVLVSTPLSSSADPVAINVTDNISATGQVVKLAAESVGVNVYVLGVPTAQNAARVEIGLAETSSGGVTSNARSTIQVADYYKGSVVVNYDGAIPSTGIKLDLDTRTVGNIVAEQLDSGALPDGGAGQSTIRENAPAGLTQDSPNAPDFYINTGAADDQIQGSRSNDFIRAGAGDDVVNAGSGNDIVRGGAGSDTVTLGDGDDIYYLTADQFLSADGTSSVSQDVLTDFSAAEDSIQLDARLEGLVTFTGLGTNSVTIEYGDASVQGTLTITSNGDPINQILFV